MYFAKYSEIYHVMWIKRLEVEILPTDLFLFLLLLGTREAFDHLASFPSSRKTISRLGIEPPTTLFGLDTSPLPSGSLGSSRT